MGKRERVGCWIIRVFLLPLPCCSEKYFHQKMIKSDEKICCVHLEWEYLPYEINWDNLRISVHPNGPLMLDELFDWRYTFIHIQCADISLQKLGKEVDLSILIRETLRHQWWSYKEKNLWNIVLLHLSETYVAWLILRWKSDQVYLGLKYFRLDTSLSYSETIK